MVVVSNKYDENDYIINYGEFLEMEFNNTNIILANVPDFKAHAFHLFPIKCSRRNDLEKYLMENGVQNIIHYPIPSHKQ